MQFTHEMVTKWPATPGLRRTRAALQAVEAAGTREEEKNDLKAARDRRVVIAMGRAYEHGLRETVRLRENRRPGNHRSDDGRRRPGKGAGKPPQTNDHNRGSRARDPEWIGVSSFYPQMRDSVALVHESGNNPGQAGWIMNIPPEQDFYTGDAPFP